MSTTLNNKKHEQALKVADEFVRNGGKITQAPDNYKGLTWKAPEPKRRGGRKAA